MAKPELEFDFPDAPWVSAGPATPGILNRELSRDPDTGDATILQRYQPGAHTAADVITHAYWEEVLVLDGDLYDLTAAHTITAGMYACRPPGMRHGPYRSSGGCSMLVTIRYPTGTES